MVHEFSRLRSQFWLKIFENDDSTNLSANFFTKNLIQLAIPRIIDCSPHGWAESRNYQDNYNLWIPDDLMDFSCLERVKSWAMDANNHIWLSTNKNTHDYFRGNELDYCLAYDWNIDPVEKKRTDVGEAEYQLKYQFPKGTVNEHQRQQYASILKNALISCIHSLPFHLCDFIITTIPAIEAKQNKLSWALAKYTAGTLGARFMKLTLTRDKPQMKEHFVHDKIRLWREIYHDRTMICLPQNISGEDILIVDDLYQSGASTWCLAEYLKACGAHVTIAVAATKALKDGDNK